MILRKQDFSFFILKFITLYFGKQNKQKNLLITNVITMI